MSAKKSRKRRSKQTTEKEKEQPEWLDLLDRKYITSIECENKSDLYDNNAWQCKILTPDMSVYGRDKNIDLVLREVSEVKTINTRGNTVKTELGSDGKGKFDYKITFESRTLCKVVPIKEGYITKEIQCWKEE